MFCSDDADRSLLPQAEHIAAALAEDALDGGRGSAPAAAAHRPGWCLQSRRPASATLRRCPVQNALAQRQRHRKPLMPHIRGSRRSGTARRKRARFPAPWPANDRKPLCPQRIPLGQRAGILLKVMDGPQHGTVAAGSAQAGAVPPKSRPPAPDPAPCRPGSAATASISCRMAANSPVSSLWLPRVSVTHRLMPSGSRPSAWIFSMRGGRVGKVRKDDAAHRAGQLVQQTAGLAEVGILRILADLRQCRASTRSRTRRSRCRPCPSQRPPSWKGRSPAAHRWPCRRQSRHALSRARKPSAMPRIRLAEWVLSPPAALPWPGR